MRRLFGKTGRLFFVLAAGVFLSFCPAGLLQAQEKEIRLTDGTVLYGEPLALKDGFYTIATDTLGVVSVAEGDVLSIAPRAAADAAGADASIQQYQARILADAKIMESVKALSEDEEFVKMFSDEQLMSAIQRQDFDSLQNNPKFLKILRHPLVQDMTQRVLSGEPSGGSAGE